MERINDKNKNLLISIISIIFIVAIFVCLLCNFIIENKLNWSLYPTGAMILVWFTTLPLLKLKKYKLICTTLIFSLLGMPFLLLIEYVCPVKNWAVSVGLPTMIASIVYIWIVGLLFFKSKLQKWYVASIAVILTFPISFLIETLASTEHNNIANLINLFGSILLALFLFLIGFMRKRNS